MARADICVVGAGPAGLSVSSSIRKRDVVVFEEHMHPGIPKHCSGLVGIETAKLIAKYVGNVFDASYDTVYFEVLNRLYRVSYREKFIYHVNRPLLEEKLAGIVEKRGHVVNYGAIAKPRGVKTITVGTSEYQCNTVLISEGAVGRLRKLFINSTPRFITGIQYLFRVRNIDESAIYTYYSEYTPGFFSWIIPLDRDHALVGGGFRRVDASILDRLASRISKAYNIELGNVVERFGGIIPRDKPLLNPIVANNIILHGDSVPLVKPYTGGGLHYIFKLSGKLAEALDNGNLQEYSRYYSRSIRGLLFEHLATNILNSLPPGIPVPVVSVLNRLGLFTGVDYDKHYKLMLKSIPMVFTGLLPLTLGTIDLGEK